MHFVRHLEQASPAPGGVACIAAPPEASAIEALIDLAFWTSLRREEGYVPIVSLALVAPEETPSPLQFARPLPLDPATLAKVVLVLVALILAVVLLALALIETGWGKNQLRDLIVRQANQYLTATLSIGRLEGSLLRGLQLGDVSLGLERGEFARIDRLPPESKRTLRVAAVIGRQFGVTMLERLLEAKTG